MGKSLDELTVADSFKSLEEQWNDEADASLFSSPVPQENERSILGDTAPPVTVPNHVASNRALSHVIINPQDNYSVVKEQYLSDEFGA